MDLFQSSILVQQYYCCCCIFTCTIFAFVTVVVVSCVRVPHAKQTAMSSTRNTASLFVTATIIKNEKGSCLQTYSTGSMPMIPNLDYVACCVVLYGCLELYFQVQYESHFRVRTMERQERQPWAKAVTLTTSSSKGSTIYSSYVQHCSQVLQHCSQVQVEYDVCANGFCVKFLREECRATKIEPPGAQEGLKKRAHSTQKR